MTTAKQAQNRADSKSAATVKVDPLYTIFEQHLYNFQDSDSDRKTFISNIVREYMSYLRKLNVIIPRSLEDSVGEELGNQVNTMLLKKIYGMSSIHEFQKKAPKAARKKAQAKYARLGKR